MYNKLLVVCLLLAVAAELMEGKKNSKRSHFQVTKRQSECSSDQFLCVNSGRCIWDLLVCDSSNDCGDGSDEPEDCLTRDCPEGYLKCSNGQCLNTTSYCAGYVRCRGEGLVVSDAACPPIECRADQFACGSVSKCVPKTYICDRDNDCGDWSDEQNCEERECADDEVRCQSGQCLNKLSHCVAGWTGSLCNDGSTPSFSCLDFTCPTEDNHFRCVSNGKCVSNSFRCDGYNNCDDGSDEADCLTPVQCEPGYARCPTINKCIRTMFFCNTDNDCGDNSDEQNCDERVCADDEVRCQSGQCLSKLYFCVPGLASPSCHDVSTPSFTCLDFTCPSEGNYFQCVSNGLCVSNSFRCDGYNDCDDGSDEADCPPVQCEPGYARCPTINKCIITSYFCDTYNDCGDNSDEQNCDERACADDEVRCQSGQCLSKLSFCMSSSSCRGGSSPIGACTDFTCPEDNSYFQCASNGKCVSNSSRCDGYDNCDDGSDEADCPPAQCDSGYARCPTRNKCINTRYFCDFDNDCGDNSDESPELCNDFTCPTDDNYFRCASNGKCISNSFRCNGLNNCVDGSDEADCPPVRCEPGYARCPTRNKCISTLYFCDTYNDCGDNSDEQNCDKRVCADDEVRCQSGQCLSRLSFCMSSSSCRGGSSPIGACTDFTCPEDNYFQCTSNGRCVSNSVRCDGFNDCDDGSDEADCQAVKSEPEPDIARPIPVRFVCMMSVERECPAPNLERHFVGLKNPGDVFSKLAQIDLREICTPLQEFGDCAVTSFDNSTYCQDPALAPDLRLIREFGPKVLTYVCEENIEVINREKSCLLKLNEQNQPVMMFKLMMSCAPYIVAAQAYPQEDIYCISAELQQCAKNAIAEECGDDIATVANGLADFLQDFCKEMQTLRSAPSADPVEQPSYQTYMKRHVRDFARVRKMMKSIF